MNETLNKAIANMDAAVRLYNDCEKYKETIAPGIWAEVREYVVSTARAVVTAAELEEPGATPTPPAVAAGEIDYSDTDGPVLDILLPTIAKTEDKRD